MQEKDVAVITAEAVIYNSPQIQAYTKSGLKSKTVVFISQNEKKWFKNYTVPENLTIVFDYRKSKDPTMQVYKSYLITDKEDKKAVINTIIDYCAHNDIENDSGKHWHRSRYTMAVEWNQHNFIYNTGHFQRSTESVDFNNRFEYLGLLDYIPSIVKSIKKHINKLLKKLFRGDEINDR